jgi:hypothetical protein
MKLEFTGRKKPYTQIGIRRLKCQRCGGKPEHQWNCCANDNRWVPVCRRCDIELNRLALDFFKIKGRKSLMKAYRN